MISTIIFSEGNPLRAEALLTSLHKNAKKVFQHGNIIYKSDSEKSDEAYYTAQNHQYPMTFEDASCQGRNESYPCQPSWKKVKNFKEDVVSVLESIKEPFVCFLSDTDILFRNIEGCSDEIIKTFDDSSVLTFNMRLGINTTKCYLTSVDNKLYGQEPAGDSEKHPTMKFDWQKHYLDFAMPFSRNGCVYRTQEILKMIKKLKFESAQEMEDALYLFQDYPKNKMASFINSAVVTIPTSEIKSMIKGNKPARPEDNKQISEKFIAGERIDFEAMKLENVDACFIEIEYQIKNITVNA